MAVLALHAFVSGQIGVSKAAAQVPQNRYVAFLPITQGNGQATETVATVATPVPSATASPAATPVPTATPSPTPSTGSQSVTGNVFHVSKAGNNADGRSWATAWNELNQIRWEQVKPGDTVLLDGGASQMVYTTTLTIGASGTASAPVTVRLAGEPGRNGRAVIFGGRAIRLPYYGQPRAQYAEPPAYNAYGILVGSDQVAGGRARSYVVIDGTRWGGIRVHGAGIGVRMWKENDHITLRNLEIDDNGRAFLDPDTGRTTWYPDNPGISFAGTNHLFERLSVHDNGQDQIQTSGSAGTSFGALTVRGSWLYATRTKPNGEIWNWGRRNHPDGIQVFSGREQSGLLIEHSVFGPLLQHGVILGDPGCADDPSCDWAVVHDVTIRDSLFHGNGNANIHEGDSDLVAGRPLPRRWLIQNVTSDLPAPGGPVTTTWPAHVVFAFAAANVGDLTVSSSIFTGGWGARVPVGGRYSGNVQLGGRDTASNAGIPGTALGPAVDPQYASGAAYGSTAAAASYALKSGSPAAGKGASVLSAQQLVAGG